MQESKTNQELIKQCFYYLNSFKRHRSLENIKRNENDIQQAQFHKLKQYEFFDNLELGLRALQKGIRELDSDELDT